MSNLFGLVQAQLDWLDVELDSLPKSLLGAPEIFLAQSCEEFIQKLQLSLSPNGWVGTIQSNEFPEFVGRLQGTLPLGDSLFGTPADKGSEKAPERTVSDQNNKHCTNYGNGQLMSSCRSVGYMENRHC